jgi:hypothetical protein
MIFLGVISLNMKNICFLFLCYIQFLITIHHSIKKTFGLQIFEKKKLKPP